ncbi:synaptobrevin-like protein ykt6, partial [Basidiobolus meristosporus CBS 931.73]
MKIYAISVLQVDCKPVHELASEYELSSFGFFQRGSVQEFMSFFAKTISERTSPGQRQSVEQENYIGHVFTKAEGVSGVIIVDREYPRRVAFSLLSKILDEFMSKYPKNEWNQMRSYPELKEYLTKYQDPKQADTIMRVQQDLDETKVVLHKTIESVLQRGEKIDSLVERSDELSTQSKMFYKTARKTNSCCSV